jgi:ferredoxin-NADP reductase
VGTEPGPSIAGTQGRLAWRLGRVVDTIEETPRTKTLALAVPGWPGHRAGQHVDVRLTAEDGYQAQRSYSIASPPEEGRVLLTIERLADGEVSPYLTDELRPGDQLELRGPIGGYFTWTTAQGGPLVLVAGGSGIVPLMAMIRHRARAGSDVPVTLLYSSRAAGDIIYRAELDRLAATDPAMRVVYTLTREQPPAWPGYRRRIDIELLAESVGPPTAGAMAFVCGPTRLVENVATDLVALGYAAARVKTERFGPTGGES